jgi:hypothetical protein
MSTPPEKPKPRINPLLENDEDLYAISRPPPAPEAEPQVISELVKRHMQRAEEKRVSEAEGLPPPPRWPMIEGVLSFPFYLNALGSWMFISFGLMVTGWLLMFWIEYGAIGGMSTAYYIGMPTCLMGILTIGYAASCCLTIIQETSNGWDTFEVSPGMEWKEWVWSFAHIMALLLQAGMVGYIALLLSPAHPWLSLAIGAFVAFPFVLLGALAADGAWVPLAIGAVFRSLVRVWWAWALFFLEITPMVVAWVWLTTVELHGEGDTPWLVPLYSAPLLAAIILIYARLIGRLAGCIAATTTSSTEGDDDDD